MNRAILRMLGIGATILVLDSATSASALPGPPSSHYHSVSATLTNAGNAIQGDGGVYASGASGIDARIWDFDGDVADHLHFQVEQKSTGRFLKLVIDDLGVDVLCKVGRLKPNESLINFEWYDEFEIGQSTSGPENFGGTFRCTTDKGGKTGWFVHWDPADECIVITKTGNGTWSFTAGAGCLADVSQIVNGSVQPPVGAYGVPFQLDATEIP